MFLDKVQSPPPALEDHLSNYVKLAHALPELTELEVLQLLKAEVTKGKGRGDIVNRLYSKYNSLRRDRQLREIYAYMGERS